ncbi:MAG: bifunctional folylpolyglutamate synthase/dihydrofolate synthase [candidate division Zixibacteria bacterium]|nr:bifunctional folylpolyglutamate synthase/dihydrofolate synthase [candidate division Zixibacteria bacterium]
MTYRETLDFLYSIERFGIKLGLERIRAYLDAIDNPQDKYPTVHIAGTNGKGSTAAFIQSILTAAGFKVGLLTSPHLVDFTERMRIGYRNCEENFVVRFVEKNRKLMDDIPVSFFEITTAMAFEYFAEKEVDFAVIEVGMGGRLDATNVITPLVSIITNISLEHTKSLGDTVELIAREKAGIIKPGVPCITASRDRRVRKTLREICKQRNSNLISVHDENQWLVKNLNFKGTNIEAFTRTRKYNNIFVGLPGRHQLENALTALTAIEILRNRDVKITDRAVLAGFRDVKWKGRLQVLSEKPLVLADVAHNTACIEVIRDTIKELAPGKKIITIFGVLSDKDYNHILWDIQKFSQSIILTKPSSERAADPADLEEAAKTLKANFVVIPNVREAFQTALKKADADDIILLTGSHYTVGEVLSELHKT